MKKSSLTLAVGACIVALAFPIYSFMNPTLTQTQVFLDLWPVAVVVGGLAIIGVWMLR